MHRQKFEVVNWFLFITTIKSWHCTENYRNIEISACLKRMQLFLFSEGLSTVKRRVPVQCLDCTATFIDDMDWLDHMIDHSTNRQYGGNMEEAVVAEVTSDHSLSVQRVCHLVETAHRNKVRARLPKGGEIYVFDVESLGNDWRVDGYMWKQNTQRKLPGKNPVISKVYFYSTHRDEDGQVENNKDFIKTVYTPIANTNVKVVHYIGDESTFQQRPHGNSNTNRIYKRTTPSVLTSIRVAVADKNPNPVYKDMTLNIPAGSEDGIDGPRDLKQVANTKHREDNRLKLSRDDLYNLQEIGFHLSDFVWHLTLIPDLVCVVGWKSLLSP